MFFFFEKKKTIFMRTKKLHRTKFVRAFTSEQKSVYVKVDLKRQSDISVDFINSVFTFANKKTGIKNMNCFFKKIEHYNSFV